MANPTPPHPVESTEAGAEAPAALEAPGKKAWSKPTVKLSDGILPIYSGPAPHSNDYDTFAYYPRS